MRAARRNFQTHRLTLLAHASYDAPNWRRIFSSSNGICTQFAVAKMAIGARNIGHAPIQSAIPKVTRTRPRYIGLRVSLKGREVTSLRFTGEVGLISVPPRRYSGSTPMSGPFRRGREPRDW